MTTGNKISGYLTRDRQAAWHHSLFGNAAPPQGEVCAELLIAGRGRRHLTRTGLICGLVGTVRPFFDLVDTQGRAWLSAPVASLNVLRGPFALAIIDAERGEVLLAVDRFATENLFYVATADGIAFASRAADLADHPQVQRRFKLQSLYNSLYFHCLPGPDAGYVGMARLLPGHYLRWHNGQWDTAAFWAPTFLSANESEAPALATALRSALQAGVVRSLPEDAPACFLSGGLDSSTVAGYCGQARPRDTVAYTIGFEAEGYDEMAYAQAAAQHFGLRHERYYVTPADVISALPTIVGQFDAPFGNASAIPTYYCAKLAASRGHSTILAGDGGDELFGGNERYAKQLVFERYQHLPRLLRWGLMEPLARGLPDFLRRGLIGKTASYIRQAATPLPDRLMAYNLLNFITPDSFLAPDVLGQCDQHEPLQRLRDLYQAPAGTSTLNRLLKLDWLITLADSDLPKVSRMCALAGIEVAFPMLDEEVVTIANRLRPEWKLGANELRPFYRSTFANFLPSGTLNKSKQGFGLPFGVWLHQQPGLQAFAQEQLEYLENIGLIQPAFRANFFTQRLSEHPAFFGTLAWVLMSLALWLRQARVTLVP